MPGIIRVTVLEAFDLPAGAADGKYVSVKVSIGKREFQTKPSKADGGKTTTWNSDFVFPVLNLRDNLVVVLLGSKGEDLSRNEIDASSIVEKGSRDEALPLKGGGCVHLRLNFVLTEEERRRIEVMRAAALKRREQEASKLSGKDQPLLSAADGGARRAVLTPTITGKETNKVDVLNGVAPPSPETLDISCQNETGETLNALKEINLGGEVKQKAKELNPPNLNPAEEVARYVEETPTSQITTNANKESSMDLTGLNGESYLVADEAAKKKIVEATQWKDRDIFIAAPALSIQEEEEGTPIDEKSLDFDPWSSQGSIRGSISATPLIQVPAEAAHSENMMPLDLNGMGSKSISLNADKENPTSLLGLDPVEVEKPIEPESCLASAAPNLDANTENLDSIILINEAICGTDKGSPLITYAGFKDKATQSFVDTPQTSGSTALTSSTVKSKVKAYEKSFSQDAGYINQMLAAEGGKLQGNINVEWKKNVPYSSLEEQAKPLEEEEDASNLVGSGKADGVSFSSIGHVELTTDGDMHSEEERSKVVEKRGANANPTQQLLILGTAECLDDVGTTDIDLALKESVEEFRGEEYTPCLREQEEKKKLNSSGHLGLTKQVLSGAVIVVAGILLWAANSNRRSSTPQRSRTKKRR